MAFRLGRVMNDNVANQSIKKGAQRVEEAAASGGGVDQFDLGCAEFKAPVGWKMCSKWTRVHVCSSGRKSGIKGLRSGGGGVCMTAADTIWDGLPEKE